MQNDLEAILIEYRDADVDRRLHMFLAYRGLRDHFKTIDCSVTDDQFTGDNASPRSAGLVAYVIKCFVGAMTRFMRFPDLDITARK